MPWKRKILRRMYGPVCIKGTWRIRSNKKLENVYNTADFVTEIESRRIEWVGHVLRMESSRVLQKILNDRSKGKRSIGRPILRWLDVVMNDLRNMG
jgi:hypothetical protein